MNPAAIILSGGPASVHVDGAPSVDPELYTSGVPMLGICYGAQLLARDLGGTVAKTGTRRVRPHRSRRRRARARCSGSSRPTRSCG